MKHAKFNPKFLQFLVCPVTHGVLLYDADREELISVEAMLAYPIRNGIPIMLKDEARRISAAEVNAAKTNAAKVNTTGAAQAGR